MTEARKDSEGWVRCPNCGHKLFLQVEAPKGDGDAAIIEIKCHSCKAISVVKLHK